MPEHEDPKDQHDSFLERVEMLRRHEQHDLLWWAFGGLALILQKWKVVMILVGAAAIVGGTNFVENVRAILLGLIP